MQKIPCPKCGDLLTPGILCPKDRTAILGPDIRVEKKYILGAKLGSNSIGEVWSAKDANHKFLTLRFLRAKLTPESIDRWQSEVRTVNQIGHRNLQEIFAFGKLPDKTPYCVAELLEGESLKDLLAKHKALPPAWIEHIFGQVCRALQAVHDRKIAHLNIKPSTIYLVKTKDAHLPLVKILDFGTSHFSEQDTNAIFREPAYLSPEQCAGAKKIDYRADLYSLGIVLFEMLVGQTPFAANGASAGLIVAQHINGPIPRLSQFSKQKFPSSLDKVIMQALAKEPDMRFQSANEFYQKLTQSLNLPKEPAVKMAKPKAAPRPMKSLIWIGAGVLMCSVMFTTVLALILTTPEPTSETPSTTPKSAATSTSTSGPPSEPIADVTPDDPLIDKNPDPDPKKNKIDNKPDPKKIIAHNPKPDPCKSCSGSCVNGKCQVIAACDQIQCTKQGGTCDGGTCVKEAPPDNSSGASSAELLERARSLIMQGDCDTGMSALGDYQKKAGNTSNYYWFKAYCFRDSSPPKACKYYKSFLQVAPSGSQASQAKAYMQDKKDAGYEECE